MKILRLPLLAAAAVLGFGTAAQAALVVNATVGGAPTGVSYVNFDNLPLGSAGGASGGIGVSFTGTGQTVVGSASGLYAAPFISNSNGVPFGDPTVSGPDTTRYLTSGIGSVTLTMPGSEEYLGLLWGSVDTFNTLTFYNGATVVGTLTGSDVTASANGNQGAMGTFYVNVTSSLPFTSVVASASSYSFELDNVSYNPTAPNSPVPEPITLSLLGLGLIGMGFMRRGHSAAT